MVASITTGPGLETPKHLFTTVGKGPSPPLPISFGKKKTKQKRTTSKRESVWFGLCRILENMTVNTTAARIKIRRPIKWDTPNIKMPFITLPVPTKKPCNINALEDFNPLHITLLLLVTLPGIEPGLTALKARFPTPRPYEH